MLEAGASKGRDGYPSWSLGTSNTRHVELSPVLRAMGIAAEVGMGAVRFSLGAGTTIEEIDTVLNGLSDVFHDSFCLFRYFFNVSEK
uniref:Uncharacterized protein n=1 Tax=Candidatus Kentrum sp. LPFa TaxID=2126335 RepID=A0A450WSH5_9GAMM|nr:MAG: hypothetical protein BECKLPF1236B_GA0070989_11956 [Candidatus Kentron sp. LPFa]